MEKRPSSSVYVFICVIGLVGLVMLTGYIVKTGGIRALSDFTSTSTDNGGIEGTDSGSGTSDLPADITITAPLGVIQTIVASTQDQQELGLGQRSSLSTDYGMLFPFQTPGQYGFWMKDMSFPLDMVWIDSRKTVVGVAKKLFPDTYPEVFMPPSDISYVLEINAGAADKFGIATGTQLEF